MIHAQKSQAKSKKILKWCIIIAVIILVPILAFCLPYLQSDGTEKFTGKEKQIAQQAVGDGNYNGPSAGPIPNIATAFKIKATKVYKLEPQKACGPTGKNPGITYIVEISRVTFFGITMPAYDSWQCSFES